jgi:hypothetical protein
LVIAAIEVLDLIIIFVIVVGVLLVLGNLFRKTVGEIFIDLVVGCL